MAEEEKTKITFEIDASEGIDMQSAGEGFIAMDKEFKHYVKKKFGGKEPYEDEKLIIGKVKEGSQVYELFSYLMLGGGLLFAETFTTLADFYVYIDTIIDYLKSPKGKKKPEFEHLTMENIIAIMNLIPKPDSKINISINAPVTNSPISINYAEGRQIIVNAKEELDTILKPKIDSQRGQVVMFQQLNKSLKARSGNKAIIPSISNSQRDVYFASDDVKKGVIQLREQNPFIIGFLADVEVIQIQGRPDTYNIISIISEIEAPEIVEE